MTEYKKLVALTDLIVKDVTDLFSLVDYDAHATEVNGEGVTVATCSGRIVDPEQMYAISSRIRQSVAEGYPRIRKMVWKARETDPNRQFYNETMCTKIEDLFKTFCRALVQLSPDFFINGEYLQGDLVDNEEVKATTFVILLDSDFNVEAVLEKSVALQKVEEIHNRHILNRAKREAWQSRMAQSLSDVVLFEGQQRSLAAAEEKNERTLLVEARRIDRLNVVRVLEERERAKWNAEVQRRDAERKRLHENTTKIDDITNVPSVLQTALPDRVLRRKLVAHIQQLITVLLKTPEDINVRCLRNNNEHLICDYGHPCLIATTPKNMPSEETMCACASVVCAAEMLWHRMGYSIRYTSAPNRSVETAKLERRAEGLILPCSRSLAEHTYNPLGFEDYSERFFELMEPNAMKNPDEWMAWYRMVHRLEQVLTEMLSK